MTGTALRPKAQSAAASFAQIQLENFSEDAQIHATVCFLQ